MGVDYEATVRSIVIDLQQRLDDPPDFRELAAAVHLSPYHFHRIFRSLIGESPAELVRRLRMERAAWQVRHTASPITEIAFACAYQTHESFTKAFQSAFGMTPSAFRAGLRDCPGIRAANGVHYHPEAMTKFHLPKHGGAPMKFDVVEMPALRLAAVRHVGPYFEIGSAFGQLEQRIASLGLDQNPDAIRLAMWLDNPDLKRADELRSLAAISVAEDAAIGDLEESRLPAGTYLRAEFVGHFSGLGEGWAQVYGEIIPSNGYLPRDGVTFEVYVSDHDTTPPDELRTDLYVPIDQP
jgi:AraC family transcriptional regulator